VPARGRSTRPLERRLSPRRCDGGGPIGRRVPFVGDDWAEDHHDVEIVDDTGGVLARRRLSTGLDGITVLHAWRASAEGWADWEPAQVAGLVKVGIKTDRRPWWPRLWPLAMTCSRPARGLGHRRRLARCFHGGDRFGRVDQLKSAPDRVAKDTGLQNLPLRDLTQNQIWRAIVALTRELSRVPNGDPWAGAADVVLGLLGGALSAVFSQGSCARYSRLHPPLAIRGSRCLPVLR
jgi:hypothetical protein